jgi:hypothetical protein
VDAERLGHLHLGHPGSDPQPRSRSASLKASAGAAGRISITFSMMRVLERFEFFSNNLNRLVEVVRFERTTPASRGQCSSSIAVLYRQRTRPHRGPEWCRREVVRTSESRIIARSPFVISSSAWRTFRQCRGLGARRNSAHPSVPHADCPLLDMPTRYSPVTCRSGGTLIPKTCEKRRKRISPTSWLVS